MLIFYRGNCINVPALLYIPIDNLSVYIYDYYKLQEMQFEILLEARRSDVFFAFAVFQTSDRSEMMQICENTHKRMTTEILCIKQKGADERKI